MTAGRFTAPRIAIGAVFTTLIAVIVWSCAGELDDVEKYRLGASVLRSCFGDKDPPKFLTSSRCKQCHLSKDNGIGAALDLTSADIGGRFSKLIGSCPEELLIDPANPEASTLYQYVNDEIDGCTYHKMPPTGAGLSAADRNCLLTWIDGLDNVDDLGTGTEDGGPDDDGEGGGDGGDTSPGDGDGMMPTDQAPTAPTLADLQDDIFDPICSECHKAGSPPQGLILGPGLPLATLRANIVNKASNEPATAPLITPNDPGNSYLLIKVKGTQGTAAGCTTSTCGARMPANGPPYLTTTQIQAIEDWINAGAP